MLTRRLFQCLQGKPVQSNSFTFDHVFDTKSTSSQIFDTMAREIVDSVMGGIHGTIFAYGQTSSGKTHTMQVLTRESIRYCLMALFAT